MKPKFTGEWYAEKADYETVLLMRLCKIVTRGVGRMFGLSHCIYY